VTASCAVLEQPEANTIECRSLPERFPNLSRTLLERFPNASRRKGLFSRTIPEAFPKKWGVFPNSSRSAPEEMGCFPEQFPKRSRRNRVFSRTVLEALPKK
jgi:hypothetical protein